MTYIITCCKMILSVLLCLLLGFEASTNCQWLVHTTVVKLTQKNLTC